MTLQRYKVPVGCFAVMSSVKVFYLPRNYKDLRYSIIHMYLTSIFGKKYNILRLFLKYLVGPFLRSLRSKEAAWSRRRILRLKKNQNKCKKNQISKYTLVIYGGYLIHKYFIGATYIPFYT